MAPSAQAYNRSHSLLLFQKLLALRDSSSPLNLILDNLEQSAAPLVQEFISRARTARSKVVFVSFATVKKPRDVDVFIKARAKSLQALKSEIASHYPPLAAPASREISSQRILIVIDSLNTPASVAPQFLPAFLSSLVTPATSLVAVYHTDVPLVVPGALVSSFGEYAPQPLTVLSHLATTVFRVSSLHQIVDRRSARDRSLPEPEWGLREGREGVLVGLRRGGGGGGGGGVAAGVQPVVVEMEMRRRSGRAVTETFVLAPPPQATGLGTVTLLSDHPSFASPEPGASAEPGEGQGQSATDEMMTTFNLGLTEKQRRDREGIVLPYFDAQTDIGTGEGGRILYEMGWEDDFDEEEDEL